MNYSINVISETLQHENPFQYYILKATVTLKAALIFNIQDVFGK